MSNIQNELRAMVNEFVDELAGLMQSAIEEAARGSGSTRKTKSKKKAKGTKKRGRPAKKTGSKKKASKKRARKVGGGGRRIKRSAGDLAKLEASLLREIKRKAGQRMEDLAGTLKVSTKDLMLPAKRLLDDKKVKTKGNTRATQYFAK